MSAVLNPAGHPIGSVFYDLTESEKDAGLALGDLADPTREPGDIRRYGTNTTPGTTDMTAAITAAASTGLLILQPETYLFSQLSLPANLVIRARGATLRYDGSTSGSTVPLRLGANTRFDEIWVTTPGTETNSTLISIGAGTQGEVLRLEADTQSATSGAGILCVDPQDTQIARVKVVNVDRPLHLSNTSTSAQTTGAWIGFLEAENYVRGFRATFCSFELGGMFIRGRSANASQSPGHNGILIVGCKNWKTGDLWIEDSAEHAIRIGGSAVYSVTEDFQIGDVFAVRPGGCAIKFNANSLASPGVTEKTSRFKVGHVIGIDVGDPAATGNEELLRLTHVRDGYIASALAYKDTAAGSAFHALRINDADNITIGVLGGEDIAASFIFIDGESDTNETTSFGDDVTNLYIGELVGTCNGSAIVVDTEFDVGHIKIADMAISGWPTYFINWTAGNVTAPIEIVGRVLGAVSPALNGIPSGAEVYLDVRYGAGRYIGKASGMRITATNAVQIMQGGFDPSNAVASTIFANAANVSSGNFGGALELSRQGSSRRGGAVVVEQTGANAYDTGLTFYFSSDEVSTDALSKLFKVLHTGSFYIPYEPVYADNAAAIAGGLTAGMTYHTSTGERRVVV